MEIEKKIQCPAKKGGGESSPLNCGGRFINTLGRCLLVGQKREEKKKSISLSPELEGEVKKGSE